MEVIETSSLNLEQHQTLTEISDDEINLPPSDDEEDAAAIAASAAAKKESRAGAAAEGDVDEGEKTGEDDKLDAQVNGVMVLTLLDKIIGAVDQIQQTQSGLEARQQDMERSVSSIQGELSKLSKSHGTTANSVNKMLEKVRKVSVNVKTVRANLEKQGGQIKRLENNENELLKRRNFKVMIYQDEVKVPSKVTVSKSMKLPEAAGGRGSQLELKDVLEEPGAEEAAAEAAEDKPHVDLSSDEEDGAVEEALVEETRAERIKRSSLQRVHTLKGVFSKEKMDKTKQKTKESMEKTRQKTKDSMEKTRQKTKDSMEKTKQRTKESMEKTRQKTKESMEKTRHSIEKKMGKLGTRMTVNPERKEKMKASRDKVKKSFVPDHTVYARAKTAVYKVPPFTFHVKKIREGAVEVQQQQGTEMVEVSQDGEAFNGLEGDAEEAGVEMEMVNGGGGEDEGMEDEDEEAEEDEDEEDHLENEDLELALQRERDRDSD